MPFPDAVLLTQDVIDALGDDGVTFYPVRAEQVSAYLAAGSSGVSLTGVMDFLPIETETGDVAVDTERVTFDTDDTTFSDNGIARNTCIEFRGVRYDVYRVLPDGGGLTRCWLRRSFDG